MMYDQSYNKNSLNKLIRRGDFRDTKGMTHEVFREQLIQLAIKSASDGFETINPLEKIHLKKKPAYKVTNLHDQLVLRKMGANLKRYLTKTHTNRSRVTSSLRSLLEEAVPYTIVRLDISAFYESINSAILIESIESLTNLNPYTKLQLRNLLKHYENLGGTGVPRGVGLSSILSDLYMQNFDSKVSGLDQVYYYARYVDDMILVVNPKKSAVIVSEIENILPTGLKLNEKKTRCCSACLDINTSDKRCYRDSALVVEFLGYEFLVENPAKLPSQGKRRKVRTEISRAKVDRIKKRMMRSLLSFARNGDFQLIRDRFKYLSSNFGITDKNTGKRVLAGIFYGYPLLNDNAESLRELDAFLRALIFHQHGRFSGANAVAFSSKQRRKLLAFSFVKGHRERNYVNFSTRRIGKIQECWRHG